MISAVSILHAHYGRPTVRGDNAAELVEHVGQCWHCGAAMERGQPVSEWSGSSFTGQEGCSWCVPREVHAGDRVKAARLLRELGLVAVDTTDLVEARRAAAQARATRQGRELAFRSRRRGADHDPRLRPDVLAPLVGYRLAELLPDGRWRVVGVVRTEREAEGWLDSAGFRKSYEGGRMTEIDRAPMDSDKLIASIESGILGAGYTAKAWSKGGYDRVYVTRYGRKECGYIALTDDGIDISQLKVPGMSDDSILAALA